MGAVMGDRQLPGFLESLQSAVGRGCVNFDRRADVLVDEEKMFWYNMGVAVRKYVR